MTQFGVHLRSPTENPRPFGELCGKVEEWGFDSVWLDDGLTRGGLEPFPALSYASSFTTHVKLGTCVYVLPLRHPLVTAKLTATVDHLSNGRLILGVGVGWRNDEFTGTGIPFNKRGRVADECLKILDQAWTKGKVDFDGEFFKIHAINVQLQPVQKPRPQIWVGGTGKAAAARAATFGEYWIPTDYSTQEYENGKTILAGACVKAHRGETEVKLASHLLVIIDESKSAADTLAKNVATSLQENVDDLKNWAIVGDLAEVSRRLEEYNGLGVEYHVLNFATKMRDEERIKLFARNVLPSFD